MTKWELKAKRKNWKKSSENYRKKKKEEKLSKTLEMQALNELSILSNENKCILKEEYTIIT